MTKTITLNKTGYLIKGISALTMWGGGSGTIKMKPFEVEHLKEVKELINDNGFGVESIDGAIIDIYENYEGSHKVFRKTMLINLDNKLSEKQIDMLWEHYEQY